MFFLKFEELVRNNNALIVDLMTEVLKVSLSYLHPCFVGSLLYLFRSLLLYNLALLFVDPPVLVPMLSCAVLGYLAIPTNKERLSIADFTGLVGNHRFQNIIRQISLLVEND
jgi:hypothetical protein